MSEKQVAKLIPIEVQYICDKCQKGSMIPTGKIFPTSPMQIEHKCNKCGEKQCFFDERYPKIIYERQDI